MSYHEAIADDIRFEDVQGRRVYYPLCGFCGNEVPSSTYIPTKKYTCDRCRPIAHYLLDLGFFPIKHKRKTEKDME